jgi:hypothetical protein
VNIWECFREELGERVMLSIAWENHGWASNRALFLVHMWKRDDEAYSPD